MHKRALVEERPWLLASIGTAIAYYLLADGPLPGLGLMALKGAGAGFLAIYAFRRHDSSDARLLVLVMVLAALGDMAMELDYVVGGAVFFASHLAMITLFLRNRRTNVTPSQKLFAVALLFLTPLIAWLLVARSENPMQVVVCALILGAMAGLAWTSSFPRYRVGVGAVLFVISDLLIFARLGGALPQGITSWLIWPIYYLGQFMIATGVIQTLRHELREE